MKHVACLFILILPSCVAGRGEGWAAVAIGTDASKLDIGPDGIHAAHLKQSTGVREAGKRLFYSTVAGAATGPLANGIGGAIKNITKP